MICGEGFVYLTRQILIMESIEDYITNHIDPEPELLSQIYREANLKLLHGHMCSGHHQGRLLKMIVHMIRPQNVLEIGTFTSYSTLCIAEGLADNDTHNAAIHTIEIDDEMEDIIRYNISRTSLGNLIKLYIADANELIPKFEDNYFEMVFMDGNKRDYWQVFEKLLPKTKKGGFILADNTLWHGKVVEKTKSNDWQTKGILEFNDKLSNDNRVEKVILPIRDGITIIRKK